MQINPGSIDISDALENWKKAIATGKYKTKLLKSLLSVTAPPLPAYRNIVKHIRKKTNSLAINSGESRI